MKLATPSCPQCHAPAIGALETIRAMQAFDGDPRVGAVSYREWSDAVVDWNQQRRVVGPAGNPLVTCVNGHEWETQMDEESPALHRR